MSKGSRIRELRKRAGITQDELATKLGTTKQTIFKYEKDIITNIPSDKIEAMAMIFDSTPEHIMGWDEKEVLKRAAFDATVAKEMNKDDDLRDIIKMYLALPEGKKKTIKRMVEDYYNDFA